MIMTGIIAFLVIAASICFYYLIFRSDQHFYFYIKSGHLRNYHCISVNANCKFY